MRLVVTALVFVGGLFFVLLGLAFLFQPETTGASLGLAAQTTQGFSTLRADFLGFFGIIGICMIWGAWKRNGDVLMVPAIMMIVVIIGRLVSAATDGTYQGFIIPIVLEAVIAAVLLVARNMLPHHTVSEMNR